MSFALLFSIFCSQFPIFRLFLSFFDGSIGCFFEFPLELLFKLPFKFLFKFLFLS